METRQQAPSPTPIEPQVGDTARSMRKVHDAWNGEERTAAPCSIELGPFTIHGSEPR